MLAFVGARPGSSELELRSVDVGGEQPGGRSERESESARTLVTGRPLHWTFCGGGTKILAHVDGTRRYGGRVAVFEPGDDPVNGSSGAGDGSSAGSGREPPGRPRVIEGDPTPFRAPACSPDGGEALVATRSGETAGSGSSDASGSSSSPEPSSLQGGRILAVDLESGATRHLATFEGRTAFSYSPDGRHIAYTDGVTTRFGGIRGQLYITPATSPPTQDQEEAGEEPRPIEDAPSVLAFFWSPDGSRLAFLQPAFGGENPSELIVALTVLDLADGSAQSIAPLNLSPIFANEVVYRFDQFARSSNIWAPDGSALALGLIDATGAPGVYVIPTPGERSAPRRVASGDLPVWNPGAVRADGDRIALTETCSFAIRVCMFR
jgi:Tol biopolymer transport system component